MKARVSVVTLLMAAALFWFLFLPVIPVPEERNRATAKAGKNRKGEGRNGAEVAPSSVPRKKESETETSQASPSPVIRREEEEAGADSHPASPGLVPDLGGDPESAIQFLKPYAWRLYREYGVPMHLSIALILHETDNLQSPLFRLHNNPAGIKCDGPGPDCVRVESWEEEADGSWRKRASYFRHFETVEEGIMAIGERLRDPNKPYLLLFDLDVCDIEGQLRALGPWATDSKHGKKLMDKIITYRLWTLHGCAGPATRP